MGPHLVRIESNAGGGPAGGETGAVAIFIPEKYNSNTELKATVAKGDNPPIDFKLEIPKQ